MWFVKLEINPVTQLFCHIKYYPAITTILKTTWHLKKLTISPPKRVSYIILRYFDDDNCEVKVLHLGLTTGKHHYLTCLKIVVIYTK